MNPPYVLLGNGRVAQLFLREMESKGTLPDLVVLNRPGRQRGADEIKALCKANRIAVAEWSPEEQRSLPAAIREIKGCWLLSVYFGEILNDEILGAAAGGAVNLHASLLPWNRGANTNVWPFIDGSPAGVTVHVMRSAVDAGAVLASRYIEVEVHDTAASLYKKLEDAGLELLLETWPGRVMSAMPGQEQRGEGTKHSVREFKDLEKISLDGRPDAIELFNLLRAKSFPPYPGLIIEFGGKRVEASISLRKLKPE